MSNDFPRNKRLSVPKLMGVTLLISTVLVGVQFHKQLQQPHLLFSVSSLDNRHLNYAMMEASALLFGRNSTHGAVPTKPKTENTILVSNMFTKRVISDQNETKKHRNIFFIHVGKTGGTTLRETVLRFGCRLYGNDNARARCFKFLEEHPESVLGQRTRGIFHYQQKHPKNKKQINRMDWMFVIREPISRFMSSYEYISPHNCIPGMKERNMDQKCNRQYQAQNIPGSFPSRFFYDCFPTIQAFLDFEPPLAPSGKKKKKKGKRNKKGKKKDVQGANDADPHRQECYELWKGAFTPGLFSDYGHMTANYQYYTKGLKLHQDIRNVYVIRTENLWHDVSTIDTLVGGTGNFSHISKRIVNQQSTQSTTTDNATLVSGYAKPIKLVPRPFCCALLPDMLAFGRIVNRADNLKDEEKQETNARAWMRCSATSWEDLQSKCDTSTRTRR